MQEGRIELNDIEYINNSSMSNMNNSNANNKAMLKVAFVFSATILIASHKVCPVRTNYMENTGEIIMYPEQNTNSYFIEEKIETPVLTNVEIMDVIKMENLNKIENMKKFEYNWNGNGGLPFSAESLLLFQDLIQNVIKQPEIAPTGRESLLVQYELDDKSYLGFEIFKDKATKVLIPQRDYFKAIEEEVTENIVDFVNKNVENFYGQRNNT